MKRFVVVILLLLCLTACGQENSTDLPKKTETEMTDEIKAKEALGTYESGDYEEMYLLGTEGQLVILKKGENTYILADNPDLGHEFYEKVSLKKERKVIGASAFCIVFEDKAGKKYGVKTIRDAEDIRLGIALLPGDLLETPFTEMLEEDRNYISIFP